MMISLYFHFHFIFLSFRLCSHWCILPFLDKDQLCVIKSILKKAKNMKLIYLQVSNNRNSIPFSHYTNKNLQAMLVLILGSLGAAKALYKYRLGLVCAPIKVPVQRGFEDTWHDSWRSERHLHGYPARREKVFK